jgi:hypothetical protein
MVRVRADSSPPGTLTSPPGGTFTRFALYAGPHERQPPAEEMLDDGTLPTATRVDRSRARGRPTRWFPLPRAVDPEARALEAFRLEGNVEAR